jgi:pimeloyl-ACP methyl ester carboxylesterase
LGRVIERQGTVDGTLCAWREAPGPPGRAPVVYLHGSPTHGEDWVPFLERTGGLAPDLPGFGRSGKAADFPYSLPGYAAFLEAFLRDRGAERLSLVMHDIGCAGLLLAQRAPARVERLVIIDGLPLLPGYGGHRLAHLWRTPVVGELVMALTGPRTLRWAGRLSRARGGPLPPEVGRRILGAFDHGTQRAILRLYRSVGPGDLERLGAHLDAVTCPALVVWGMEDPYLPVAFARRYGEALGGPARVEEIAGAGHWPWLDRPEVVGTVASFLEEEEVPDGE